MDKMTLRRIGWIGASLGLTSVLVGCNDMQSDASTSASVGGSSTASGYISTDNGLFGLNGLTATNGLIGANGLVAGNGLTSANGLGGVNGLTGTNGLVGANGFTSGNGLTMVNGFNFANGLTAANGLTSTNGVMTSDSGRQTVSYLVKCALAAGDTLVKQDDHGNNFTFKGSLGLAPEYKNGGCAKDCLERLSSCLMAHINTSGVHIPLWMTSPEGAVGWGQSPSFPTQEGTFFGQIMLTNAANNLDGYYCNGASVTADVVPGRLGSNQGATPYANAFASDGGLCAAAGHCSMHALTTGESLSDGAESCPGNGITWTHPINVWRGQTFQADSATLVGSASVVTDGNSPHPKRVSNLGKTSTVKFTGVAAAADGTNNLVVYYANGDTYGLRYFNVVVNGGAAQSKGFKYLDSAGNWDKVGQATITLTGFKAGTTNTVEFQGDGVNSAPDLDWIEVIGASSNFCDHSRWTVTASNSSSQDPPLNATDGYDVSRWTSGRNQDGTDWYQVDFGGMVTMSNLTLTNGGYDPNDYPGQLAVYGSTDGTSFGSAVATVSGATNQTVVTFPPMTVRAIKLKQLGTSNGGANGHWWSIHEFDSDCAIASTQTAPGTCDQTKWVESFSINASAAPGGDDGNLSTRFTTGRAMQVGDYYQVDFLGMVNLTQLTLNNTGTSGNDYAGSVGLYGSADGVTFDSTPFATGNGATNATVITFAQRSLHAVRIKVSATRSNWWSIGELQGACTL